MRPTEDSFINIHTHHKPKLANEFAIRNAYLKLNTDKLNNLSYAASVGLHPWFLQQYTESECTDLLIEMATSEKVLAIGEIGIDKAIETPLKTQLTYFEAQLNIARALQKPLIIHAVKSYNDFIPYLKKAKIPFIFHRFSGNQQQANELLKQNAHLSFGNNLFEEKSALTFKAVPFEHIFLETDTTHQYDIEDIYQKAAQLRDLELHELKSIVFHNFARVFGG